MCYFFKLVLQFLRFKGPRNYKRVIQLKIILTKYVILFIFHNNQLRAKLQLIMLKNYKIKLKTALKSEKF